MDETTTADGTSAQSKDMGNRGDVILPVFPFLYDDTDDDEEYYGIDDDDDSPDKDLAPAFALTKLPSVPSPSTPRTMKITMPFMRAYKAMRGPRDVEPSPLFACLRGHHGKREEGHDKDPHRHSPDPFVLVDRDEVKLLNQVKNSLYADDYDDVDDDDEIAYVYSRRLQALKEDHEDVNRGTSAGTGGRGRRQTVFFFETPVAPPPVPDQQKGQAIVSCSLSSCENCNSCGSYSSCSSCSSCSVCRGRDVVKDHVLDGAHLDAGWLATGADAYVSDDDGPPADTRLTPAIFRTLATGCTRNDVDALRLRPQPEPASSSARFRTPRTPPNTRKIVADSHADNRLNNVRPHRHRRQFDFYTGEELSPLYRVERGTGGSGGGGPLVWSPPGLTPERAGFLLRERRPGLSDGGGGSGSGGDWSLLYQRMAPAAYQALQTRLYGDAAGDGASEERKSTSSDAQAEQGGEHAEDGEGEDEQMVAAETLLGLHNGWKAVETAQAEDARLEAAHAQAEAILTAQARCLTRLEYVRETKKQSSISNSIYSSESFRSYQETEDGKLESGLDFVRRTRGPLIRKRGNPAVELQICVRQEEARVAQAWERQRVLAQRVQQGEARLAREAVAAKGRRTKTRLLDELAVELAQLGVSGRV